LVQDTYRIRSRGLAAFVLSLSLLLSALLWGVATDQARAGEAARDRSVMLQLTNQARLDHRLDALRLDRQLSRYAMRHSRAMANRGELFHTENLTAVLGGVRWSVGGENVGMAPTLRRVHSLFMRSAPHRRNILREEFDHTAIGVVESDGSFWVTVIFYG
jgi:uncharacterized protein YkwD